MTAPSAVRHASPYRGFWMGGYEGADHINGRGMALDMARASGHLDRLEEDHRRAAQAGLRCVRESIGWRLAEAAGGAIDLSRAERIAHSAHRHGLQVLWTLMHYGLPGDLSLHDDAMIPRLARFAAEVARTIGRASRAAPVFTPVNEIGYLAWAASHPALHAAPNNTPDPGPGGAGSSLVSGYAVKRRLVRATLAAMAAMREVEPRSRFLHVEPVVHVVAPRAQPELAEVAAQIRSWQWQSWDLIIGRTEPALGGAPEWLDLLGINHYHSSQWEAATEQRLDWHGRDPRRMPLAALLAETWQRYGRPLMLAETSHVGAGRGDWIADIGAQVRDALRQGVPVQGVCLYPLVDRPDWNSPERWHRSGLWHVAHDEDTGPAPLPRVAEPDAMAALRAWQQHVPLPGLRAAGAAGAHGAAPPLLLLAFSHLRWDFVRHRTRQLLSRLATRRDAPWRVVVVEEPLYGEGPPWLDCISKGPRTDVLVPHLPLQEADAATGFGGAPAALLHGLIAAWLAGRGIPRLHQAVAWLTTPMAWPLAQALRPGRVVYDCADELAGFMPVPAALPTLEAALLARADAVFAATASLAAPRAQAAGRRLHLLPNGVDAAAFARSSAALSAASAAPRARRRVAGWDAEEAAHLLAALPAAAPCLGYAGVVDERMDLALLAALADARPQWQIVLVGPVVKIARESLPLRPNLHWLGEQPWRVLPALMARWRVALLPFVLTAATRSSMPLKVLEALAAGLPVVATPLPELRPWRDAGVALADDAAGFEMACETALTEAPAARAARYERALRQLRPLSWDRAAAQVQAVLAAPVPSLRSARA